MFFIVFNDINVSGTPHVCIGLVGCDIFGYSKSNLSVGLSLRKCVAGLFVLSYALCVFGHV